MRTCPLGDGLRLAFSLLTVLPVRARGTDRRAATWAIGLAPLAGLALGAVATGVLAGLAALHCPPLVAGLLVVGLLALGTRGMHIDGLADTADGLGCYGPPERALTVLKDAGAGPFAVVTLIVMLGAQAAALAALDSAGRYWIAGFAVTAGRAAFSWCCRRGYPAARPEGLGALVAGTQPVAVPVGWAVALGAAGVFVVPGRWWQGVAAIVVAALVVAGLAGHVRRRFGGLVGDVLGAACEATVTAVLVVTAFGS
ncbi:MAG TPA: adenosylcobinamide-GDP ribazoletransferase [Pseudonocardiaceae bacterium]|nr:adenosylcobinamide-GDP ribazoletransferase [Pseudonocardiaceae bacterium]